MYETSAIDSLIIVVPTIIGAVLYIILFANVISISKNVRKIEERMSDVFNRNDIFMKIYHGKSDEAMKMVVDSFIRSCLLQLEKYNDSNNVIDLEINKLKEDCVFYYGKLLPGITKDFLNGEYGKVEKFYKK